MEAEAIDYFLYPVGDLDHPFKIRSGPGIEVENGVIGIVERPEESHLSCLLVVPDDAKGPVEGAFSF